MTDTEALALARQALRPTKDATTSRERIVRALLEAEARGRREEREACAKLAEDRFAHHPKGAATDLVAAAGLAIAEAIRARGEERQND